MPPHVPLNKGDRLYKYELQARLGGGDFGDVWLAHDHSIFRDVAVKVLASSVTIDERLCEPTYTKLGSPLSGCSTVSE